MANASAASNLFTSVNKPDALCRRTFDDLDAVRNCADSAHFA
jgi:hypothetical protein